MSRKAKAPAVRYAPRKHYTAEELVEAAIRDLEADIKDCEARGIFPEHIAECREEIRQLRAQFAAVSSEPSK